MKLTIQAGIRRACFTLSANLAPAVANRPGFFRDRLVEVLESVALLKVVDLFGETVWVEAADGAGAWAGTVVKVADVRAFGAGGAVGGGPENRGGATGGGTTGAAVGGSGTTGGGTMGR